MKLIPLAFLGAFISGLGGLFWYELLPAGERKRIDALASQLAWSLFEKSVDQLTALQWATVITHVRKLAGLDHQKMNGG